MNPPAYYDFDTSATFTDSITVCLRYDPNSVQGIETGLRLLHWNSVAGWQDVTSSVDVAQDRICARVASLSPFAIAERNRTDMPPLAASPPRTHLHQNVPNPFNPSTIIQYDVARGEQVQVAIYDIRGQLIRTLVAAALPPGRYETRWDGCDARGTRVAAGVYVCELRTASTAQSTRLVLLK